MVGEFKNDRFAEHNHSISFNSANWSYSQGTGSEEKCLYVSRFYGQIDWGTPKGFPSATGNRGSGNTTRNKSKGVIYIIKAL